MDDLKFKPKFIKVKKKPVLIVGQNPGRQRSGDTGVVWEGNRSAFLLEEALEDRKNIILTNVCNYQQVTPSRLKRGVSDVVDMVRDYRPRMVLCLGKLSYNESRQALNKSEMYNIQYLPHPSFVLRFYNDQVDEWIQELREIIE